MYGLVAPLFGRTFPKVDRPVQPNPLNLPSLAPRFTANTDTFIRQAGKTPAPSLDRPNPFKR